MIKITDEMIGRFLAWELPSDFHPDNYIHFNRHILNMNNAQWPSGTNLFNYEQVKQMLEVVLNGKIS